MKLFKKKSLSYILVASMAMAALTGCSKDDKKAEDAVVEDNTTVTEGAAEETIEEVTEEAAEEVTEEATEESTEEVTEEATEETTEDAAEEVTEEFPEFTASDKGFGGDVTVVVTVTEDGKINSINLDVASETPTVGGEAGPKVVQEIIKNQSLAVDTVSGATVTSNAVINAVRKALTEAGSEIAQ